MSPGVRGLGAVALLLAAVPVEAQQPAAFAMLPFENSGSYGQDREVFEALELGLPVMLGRALAGHSGAALADRASLGRALAERELGAGNRFDAARAAQVAKAAGARFAVTGSFSDFYGKLRLNARVVDAQSGEILKVVSNDDPKLQDRAQLSAIVQRVSDKIAAAAGLPDGNTPPPPVPAEVITDFSRGLLHESRGESARALEFYRRAVAAAPEFAEARAGAARVGG